MDNSIIEKYKQEMLRMAQFAGQSTAGISVPAAAPPASNQTVQVRPSGQTPRRSPDGETGELIAVTTTARELYPVPYADITVFTGPYDQMDVIAVGKTDESGRSKPFELPAPPKELSQSPGANQKPYAEYNMLVQADGYADNVHMNIPVFRGVTTRQRSPMMIQTPSSPQKGPFVFKAGGRDL